MLQVALYPTIRLSSRALSVGYEHFFQEFPTDSSHLATFPENPPSRSGAYLSKCPILCPVTQAGNSGIILDFSLTLISHSQPITKSGPFYCSMCGGCLFLARPSATTSPAYSKLLGGPCLWSFSL